MITALVFSAFLAGAGDPPPAAPSSQGQATAVAPAAVEAPRAKPVKIDDKERMVCHREEITGSHREEKICHTKREWDQMTEDAQRLFREGGIQAVPRSVAGGAMPAPQ
jgi:hypothetical protein